MVASAQGAKEGILIKNTEGLERASQVDTIIVDKTGTVTEGKLTVSAHSFLPLRRNVFEKSCFPLPPL